MHEINHWFQNISPQSNVSVQWSFHSSKSESLKRTNSKLVIKVCSCNLKCYPLLRINPLYLLKLKYPFFYAKMLIVNGHIFVSSANVSGTPRHYQRCKGFTGSNSTYSHQFQIPVGKTDNKYNIRNRFRLG